MGTPNKLTTTMIQWARERRANGEFIGPIAKDLGVSIPGLHRHLRGMPIPPRGPSKNRRVDPDLALRLIASGIPRKNVAKRFKVSRTSLYRALKVHAARKALEAARAGVSSSG